MPRLSRRLPSSQLAVITVLVGLGATGPACGLAGEPGSGKPRTEVRQVEPFTEIEIGGAMNADVSIAEVQVVEISGDDNLVPLVTTVVKGGRLYLGTERNLRPKLDLAVHITVPKVAALAVSGAGRVALHDIRNDDLALDLSGAGEVTASGSAHHLALAVSGAGRVNAQDLKTDTTHVSVSGAGQADVYASQALEVDISGAGHVRYDGNPPDVRKSISGAGSLAER